MDQIIISLKSRGLLLASSVRPELTLRAWNSGKFVLNPHALLICAQYDLSCNVRFLVFEQLLIKIALATKGTLNKNAKLHL